MANPDFVDDLAMMFDDGDFAVTATLNGTVSGNVILDKDYLRAVGMVASSNPMAMVRASEYGTDCIDGTLVAGGGTYVIRDHQPQDDGAVVLLELEKP